MLYEVITNGSRACDHFNRYKEDVSLMKELGIDVYRLSISWARIMPEENVISEEGLEFYKNLLIELKENGIKASATLYHRITSYNVCYTKLLRSLAW